MQVVLQIIGLVALWIGVIFCALGVLGLLRFPDAYSRLHASGKVSTLGLCGLLVGSAFLLPSSALKVIALGIFMVISSPVASHVIALAAYRQGIPMVNAVRDDMAAALPGEFGQQANRLDSQSEDRLETSAAMDALEA
ncbi:MAG: monovalent cation/H(+) antiporter subunit G [Anaerolineae bacterium]|nr:monovalent cation/H(+) antiporter subunit G [Anaerolineae bacterium]